MSFVNERVTYLGESSASLVLVRVLAKEVVLRLELFPILQGGLSDLRLYE